MKGNIVYLLQIILKLEDLSSKVIYKYGRTGGIFKTNIKTVKTRSNKKRFAYKVRSIQDRVKELQREIKKGFFEDKKIICVKINIIRYKHFTNRLRADLCEKKLLDKTKIYYSKKLRKYSGGFFTEVRELINKYKAINIFSTISL